MVECYIVKAVLFDKYFVIQTWCVRPAQNFIIDIEQFHELQYRKYGKVNFLKHPDNHSYNHTIHMKENIEDFLKGNPM